MHAIDAYARDVVAGTVVDCALLAVGVGTAVAAGAQAVSKSMPANTALNPRTIFLFMVLSPR